MSSTSKHSHSGALITMYMNDLFSVKHRCFTVRFLCQECLGKQGGGVRHHATSQVSQCQGLGKTGHPNLVRAHKRRKAAASFTPSAPHRLRLRTGLMLGAWGMEGTGGAEQKGGFPKHPPFHEIILQNTAHCFTNCKTLFNHCR